MRAAAVFIAVLLIVASDAAAPRRDKRQVVPLLASCDVYSTCAPPAVCLSGQCQCVQPYMTAQSACVSAYPRYMSSVYSPSMMPTYLQPQQAFLHYPVQTAQAVPVPQQPLAYYPPQPVAQPPMPIPQQLQPIPGQHPQLIPGQQLQPLPGQQIQPIPEQQMQPLPGQPIQPVPVPESQPIVPQQDQPPAIVTETTSTTTFPRQFDAPSIAYPGEFCHLPQTVCVGGSICVNNICICRRGEESVNGQCEKIEVPLAAETPPALLTTTTSTSATVVPTIVGVIAPLTVSPATTTTSSAAPSTVSVTDTTPATTTTTTTSTTAKVSSTTTPSATTTTSSATTTSPTIARDFTVQSSPYRCVSCCQPNPVNCQPQVININLSYPPQNRRLNKGCQNNFQCPRGLSCIQNVCR